MFPGMRGADPRQMQRMMKQLGIKTEEISAKRVVFELENGNKLVIDNPQVSAMTIQGKKTFTVMGEEKEEAGEKEIPKEDIEMVVQQTGCSEEEAKKTLEENDGDIAQAIVSLKQTD